MANVLGVSFGIGLGQAVGWRATFWAVAALSRGSSLRTGFELLD